jgi:hypothetical protein
MIARDIGEDGRPERHAIDATLVQAVRRHLHRHASDAAVGELPEHALQLHHARRREAGATRHGVPGAPAQDAERADRCRPGAGIVEEVAQQSDGGRLPVGARHTDR